MYGMTVIEVATSLNLAGAERQHAHIFLPLANAFDLEMKACSLMFMFSLHLVGGSCVLGYRLDTVQMDFGASQMSKLRRCGAYLSQHRKWLLCRGARTHFDSKSAIAVATGGASKCSSNASSCIKRSHITELSQHTLEAEPGNLLCCLFRISSILLVYLTEFMVLDKNCCRAYLKMGEFDFRAVMTFSLGFRCHRRNTNRVSGRESPCLYSCPCNVVGASVGPLRRLFDVLSRFPVHPQLLDIM